MAVLLTLLVAVFLYISFYAFRLFTAFRANLDEARRSGIPYVVVPIYLLHPLWIHSYEFVLRLLHKLPNFMQASWIEFIEPEWTWKSPYLPFERLKTDVFLTVSPTQNVLWVADAKCISEVLTRRTEFPKAVSSDPSQDLFSFNIASSEGAIWRRHRTMMSPSFTEASNQHVWNQSVKEGMSVMKTWTTENSPSAKAPSIKSLTEDTRKLSLRVISQVGFGTIMSNKFKGGIKDEGATAINGNGNEDDDDDVLEDFPHQTSWILNLPSWISKILPTKAAQETSTSFDTWMRFVTGMLQLRREEFQSGKSRSGMDLLGCLLKQGRDSHPIGGDENHQATQQDDPPLKEPEIIGNAFVFLLAGHETVASSLHLCMLYLALNPRFQRSLHRDLDEIFSQRPVSEWSYDRDMPKLLNSSAIAILNEQLRLTPAVVNLNRCTRQPVPLKIDNKMVTIPADVIVKLVSVAVQRNPSHWPSAPKADPSDIFSKISSDDRDLDRFNPERWFASRNESQDQPGDPSIEDNVLPQRKLFRPEKGAFIPFSEGPRVCLGRRFAQTEILALLALIFRDHSVELAVDDFVSDQELEGLDQQKKMGAWTKAAERARVLLTEGITTYPTLRLHQGPVPVRFVKRGSEVFV